MCRETRHGEATIDPRVLEEAVKNALNDYLPRLEATANTRTQFFNKFQREADEHDKDFVRKYNADLDATLIFAGLFSAVTSAFIVAVQTQLQPDYNQLNYDILWAFADSTGLNSTGRIPPKPSSDSPWAGPDHPLVHVQAILFSSLAASLLAALVAVLGKQWLNRYSQVDMHGSLYDRSRDRQRKIDGMASWGFHLIMECLPLMLQVALLLLGCALSKYLFAIDHLVAWVVFGFTASGFLFYVTIVVAATISYNCPFQTPLSLIIRFIIRFDRKNTKYLKKSRDWFWGFFSRMKFQQKTPIPFPWSCCGNNGDGHDEIPMNDLFNPRLILFGEDANQEDFVLDANCIAWMFEVSMDADVILDTMRFIPEVAWHADVRTTPLKKLYDTVLECIDRSSGNPILIPKFREKAYYSAKALVHVATQRRFMGVESDREAIDSIPGGHRIIRSGHYEGDSDLESVLGMVDCVFGPNNLKPMDWHKFSFSVPHHTWMRQIIFYRAWDALMGRRPLPEDVRGFVLHTLGSDSPPPAVVTVCLDIIGLVLELRLQNNGPHVTDGSVILDSQIARIYDELAETFKNANAITPRVCGRALEAMELIVSLPRDDVAARSYELFRIAAGASVSPTHPEEIKWKVCRLALRGAYKPEIPSPPVDDALEIFNFLDHHFDLATGGDEKYDEPIQNALFALASASDPLMNNALTHFDPTKPSFVNGIRRVLQDQKPLRLRKAVLSFFPRIANIWFDPTRIIMKPNEMERFCKDWASAIDKIGVTNTTRASFLTVLFYLINSPHSRPHIVPSKWGLLEYFIADPEDSEPFERCLRNPEVVDGISGRGYEYAAGLWSKILLLRYGWLSDEVRSRFKEKVRDVLRKDLEGYRSMIGSKLKEAEDKLTQYTTWSTVPEAIDLREEIESHKGATKFLESLKGGCRF